ncbi:MAG TPA: hypothetical protein VGR81_11070 [Candidatus Acidoferrales bacterium]|nr:hypothetical protein [Candidatus Acidoferrales bacterium]
MRKKKDKAAKKKYASPALKVYGTVRDLTRAVGHHGQKDGGAFRKIRTRV